MSKTLEQQLAGWELVRDTWQAAILLGKSKAYWSEQREASCARRVDRANEMIASLNAELTKAGA